jgi:signal transduction protein with GAF and PtsI domain
MAIETVGGHSGSLMLVEDQGTHLVMAASRSISGCRGRNTKQRIGEGIAGKVAESGESLLLIGRVGDDRFQGMGGRPGIPSSICAPIKTEKKVIGVLSINSSQHGQAFTETEHQKVSNLAARIGVVINHALHFRHVNQRLKELSLRAEIEAVAQSETKLDGRLGQIAERGRTILDADTFMIYLMDKDKQHLKLHASSGISVTSVPSLIVQLGTGLVGTAAQRNRTIVLQGGWHEKDGETYLQLFHAGVPIRHGKESVGVLAVEKGCVAEREVKMVEIVESIASSIGHLICDTLSQDDSKRRLTALSALSELSVAMANSEDRMGLAKLVAYTAATILEQDVAMVRLLRPSSNGRDATLDDTELLAVHGRSFPAEDDPIVKMEAKLSDETIRSRAACVSDDLPREEREPLQQQAQLESVYSIPIQADKRILGIITAGSAPSDDQPRSMDRAYALELGSRIADYASAVAQRFVSV